MEALTIEALMRSWIAGPLPEAYREVVEKILVDLRPGADAAQAVDACAQLAMLFGDSGAPELCIVVSYRGIALSASLDPEWEQKRTTRFLSHAVLAMGDLGLAQPKKGKNLALPDAMAVDEAAAGVWIREFLSPLGGSLEAGTQFAARLAAIRVGLLPVPDPLTVHAVSHLSSG